MPGRYRFVAKLRNRIKLYNLSNTARKPFRYLFGEKSNPNKIETHSEFPKYFIDKMHATQYHLSSHQWSTRAQNQLVKLKNLWFDARTSGVSLFALNKIDSDYLSKHLLSEMTDDDILKTKWTKFTKKKLLRLGNASMNNQIEIFHRGELFFEALWNDISNAEDQILMETYIMEPDKIAIKTIKLLTEASLRGVSVTLIVDSFGSANMNVDNNEYLNELRRAGAVVLEYNKVKVSRFFEFLFLKHKFPFIFAYRNHKKIIVIDDAIGYTGGMNITGEYCGYDVDGGINKFRDTHTRLQGDIVRYLKESLYFSVIDINPTLPPTFDEEEDDDESDIDIDTDDELELIGDEGKKEKKNVFMSDAHAMIKKNNEESKAAEVSRQRRFPYQLLPGFLTKFNSYRKYRKSKEIEAEVSSENVDVESLSDNEEKVLFGRKKRWNDAWKRNKRNLHDETYKNRLKILASSPRKSLSEWMQYYEQNDGTKDEEKVDKIHTKSALEVSALSNLMEDANNTKNFSYSFGKSEFNEDNDSGKEPEHNLYVQVLESYRDKRFRLIQRALISAIDNAESHIFIMNPYFLPPRKLKKRLRNASARGVDIRVITCDQSDVPFISMASRHIYEELLSQNNVRLFEYEGDDTNECANILHGKVCIIDDVFVSLGSFNWDDWSYTKNLEMNLMIIDNKVAKSMHEQFIIDQNRSKEIKLENVQNDRSIFQKRLYYGAWVCSRIANRIT